jgi:prolipoprotein diacylglyceryltransferase
LLGRMLMLEREFDGITASFPSFHVLWSLLAAITWIKVVPTLRWIWITISLLIISSCIMVGVHSVADVLAAMVIFLIVIKRQVIYDFIQHRSERLANSWRQTTIGGFRIISHSLYAGLAATVGIFIASQFSIRYEILLIVTASSIIGGAVWGQWIEGSSKMLRPFGYYGALIGGLAGVLIAATVFDQSFLSICTVFALAAPLTQAIGRLRCLVQGCCHGAVSNSGKGIRYMNAHSRVCRISELKGVPLYNTQLYSIISNVIITLILFRLWLGSATPSLITGLYFILSGATRFVEEAYRGESQTKIAAGLRIYQWLAIAAIILGMLITIIPSEEIIVFNPVINLPVITSILIAGLSWAFAMGMDFPKSKIRFSRLTG